MHPNLSMGGCQLPFAEKALQNLHPQPVPLAIVPENCHGLQSQASPSRMVRIIAIDLSYRAFWRTTASRRWRHPGVKSRHRLAVAGSTEATQMIVTGAVTQRKASLVRRVPISGAHVAQGCSTTTEDVRADASFT